MRYKLFLIYLLFAALAPCLGQKLYFSNIPRLNSKAYYNKVIGENAGGIYILRFRDPELRGGFSIERYSHNMDFIESENLELDKREELIKVFTTDSGLIFIKSTMKQEFVELVMLRTGFSVHNMLDMNVLYQTSKLEKDKDQVVVDYNIDRKNIGIWTSEINENSEQILVFNLYNIIGDKLNSSNLNTGFNYRDVSISKAVISNVGESAMVFSIVREDKRTTDPSYTENFLVTVAINEQPKLIGIGDHKYFLSSFDIAVNEFTNTFVLSGLYDYKLPQGAHGVVNFTFNTHTTELETRFNPLDRKFVSSLIGAKQEKDGDDPEHFKIRKVVPRNDGGHLMICEFFEITQQMETFYLNGVPQTSSKNIYNYNDLMLISIDSVGNIEWRHKVNKRQNSFASMAYLQSIGIYVCEKNINLIYNDNSNQSNRVMHLKLTRNGVMEQRILLNSDNEYTAIIPLEGRQTGYNRFVTPILMNKQTMLVQLIDE